MRKFISTAWHDPVWSTVIATLIALAVISLLTFTTEWALSVLLWLWHNIFTEVWGAYILSLIAITISIKAWVVGGTSKQSQEKLDEENVRELARQVAEKEIVKYARATRHREQLDSISRRLQEVEFDQERLRAKEFLGGSYREGALSSALKMISIGRALNDDHKIDAGLGVIRSLLAEDAKFNGYQIRDAAAALESLPPEFDGESMIEQIRARIL